MSRLCSVKELAVSGVNVKCLHDSGRLATRGSSMPAGKEAFPVRCFGVERNRKVRGSLVLHSFRSDRSWGQGAEVK